MIETGGSGSGWVLVGGLVLLSLLGAVIALIDRLVAGREPVPGRRSRAVLVVGSACSALAVAAGVGYVLLVLASLGVSDAPDPTIPRSTVVAIVVAGAAAVVLTTATAVWSARRERILVCRVVTALAPLLSLATMLVGFVALSPLASLAG